MPGNPNKLSRRDFLRITWDTAWKTTVAAALLGCGTDEKATPTDDPTALHPTEVPSPTATQVPEIKLVKPETPAPITGGEGIEPTSEPKEAAIAPTTWADWDFKTEYATRNMPPIRNKIIRSTPNLENPEFQSGLKDMEGNLIAKFLRVGRLKIKDPKGGPDKDPEGWINVQNAFFDRYEFEYGMVDRDDLFRWTVLVRDTNTRELIYSSINDETVPTTQLAPFSIDATNNNEAINSFDLSSNKKADGGEEQIVVSSKNGEYFTIVTLDKDDNPLEWMDLNTGKMVEVEQGVEWTTVENIQDCAKNPLNDEDMEPGGRVDQYLAQIKPELMAETNWDIIKDDIPFMYFGKEYVYSTEKNKGEKFVNPELKPSVPDTNPFDRDIDAFGLYTAGNGRKYCFIPLVIRDIDAPTETGHDIYFLKLLLPLQQDDGTPLSQSELDYMFENWNKRMNIAPIVLRKDEDPTFDHLQQGQPGFETRVLALKGLAVIGEGVRGPLSQLKKMEHFLFPTSAANLTNADGSPSNTYK